MPAAGGGQEERRDAVLDKFRSLYGGEPAAWVRAPGRAELLGTDTDDHLGYVMTMAIHLDTWIALRPSGSSRARIWSMNVNEGMEYEIGAEPTQPASSWDRYVSGVSRVLRLRGHRPAGVEAVAHATVPIGGGLSSSASLEVAAVLMFQATGSFSLAPREMAEVCQQAENQDAGVLCGIPRRVRLRVREGGHRPAPGVPQPDPRGSRDTLGYPHRGLRHQRPPHPRGIRVREAPPGVRRGNAPAAGKGFLDQDAARCQHPAVRAAERAALPETLRRRCQFVFEENQRVVAFMAAIVRNDRAAMRELCEQSFFGERDLYEKTVPAMERMYEAMISGPGVVAARQSGGGSAAA